MRTTPFRVEEIRPAQSDRRGCTVDQRVSSRERESPVSKGTDLSRDLRGQGNREESLRKDRSLLAATYSRGKSKFEELVGVFT